MQYLKNEVKKQIIEAAINDFLIGSFMSSSIRKITKTANVSKSNFYNYFQNKEQLFEEICEPVVQGLTVLLEECVLNRLEAEEFNINYIQYLSEYLAKKIAFFIKSHGKRIIILFDCSDGTKYKNRKEEVVLFLENHFKLGLKKNIIESINGDFVLHMIASNLVEGILEIIRHFEKFDSAEFIIKHFLFYHLKGVSEFYK